MENKSNSIKITAALIVHHTYTKTSLVEEKLIHYLQQKGIDILQVTHAFTNAREDVKYGTFMRRIPCGKKAIRTYWARVKLPELIAYLIDTLITLWLAVRFLKRNRMYVGFSNLDVFAGVLLRAFGVVEYVIYYVIDYAPDRFKFFPMNWLYRKTDAFCVQNADSTWNLAPAMVHKREKFGLPEKYREKQITVPVGCTIMHKVPPEPLKSPPYTLVYVGVMDREFGVETIIKAMPALLDAYPQIRLTMIGSGPLLSALKRTAKQLSVSHAVRFTGYIVDNNAVDKLLSCAHIGLAPYIVDKESYKQYTDPGKIKLYLGAGLPVVMSDVAGIAKRIRANDAGIVMDGSTNALVRAVSELMHLGRYNLVRKNAVMLSRKYDWHTIYDKALNLSSVTIQTN